MKKIEKNFKHIWDIQNKKLLENLKVYLQSSHVKTKLKKKLHNNIYNSLIHQL